MHVYSTFALCTGLVVIFMSAYLFAKRKKRNPYKARVEIAWSFVLFLFGLSSLSLAFDPPHVPGTHVHPLRSLILFFSFCTAEVITIVYSCFADRAQKRRFAASRDHLSL